MTTEIKQEQQKLENKIHRLEEMSEAMKQSIANAEKVKHEQLTLISIVEASEKVKDFNEFIKTLKKQCDNIDEQIATLLERTTLIDKVTETCKDNEQNTELVLSLLKGLGVFEQ